MKGIVNILELLITGVILILAFLHFFPQYSIKTNWSSVLLDSLVKDTLSTIDGLNKTYDFAISLGPEFEDFMEDLHTPPNTNQTYVWWKEVDNLPGGHDTSNRPYFRKAKEETMVDVIESGDDYYVYSFTLGMGYPY